ncbi:MAG: Sir2 silent information regulator family NAD-dependent deacetylase, partial [Selenomonadaceae bacterium]|nr:Sir2 silent information regulator family NAD-dependent deacetylase [Selenomonadaceae bacterium]
YRYQKFLKLHASGDIVFLELGVGGNTPGIIKYPFWQLTAENPKARYVCINFGEAFVPDPIAAQSLIIDADIARVLESL